ncbi:MAG: N-acetyltransferase family protein [Thermodesulfobacteriota bacterium]
MSGAAVVSVRPAHEDDLEAIRGIVNWAIENTHYNFNTEPQSLAHWQAEWAAARGVYPWLVAESGEDDGGAVVGMAIASRYKGRCAYDWTAEVTVYVSHSHHRRGVGSALYRELLPTLEAQGFHALIGVIAVPNPGSIALHERFGFVNAGVTEQVGWKLGRWWGVGNWQKLLRDETHVPQAIVPFADLAAGRHGP